MAKENPLVSVIIPTYDRGHYLELTLRSVVQQTYSNIEVIVVDDGTFGNENEEICAKFSKIIYTKIENSGGPCKPRNTGILKSNGKYIAFLDDDDIWLPNKISMQVGILENNADFGLVHNYCNVIDELGKATGEIVGRPEKQDTKHGNVLMRMIGNWTLMMPTPLLRKTLVDEVGFFNENMPQTSADVEYWTRCAFHTKFYYIDNPLVNYRKHSNNMSTNNKDYLSLPLYLDKIVNQNKNLASISKMDSKVLKTNLLLMQAKMIKNNIFSTIVNLFKLNPFWFFNFRVQKTIIKKLIT